MKRHGIRVFFSSLKNVHCPPVLFFLVQVSSPCQFFHSFFTLHSSITFLEHKKDDTKNTMNYSADEQTPLVGPKASDTRGGYYGNQLRRPSFSPNSPGDQTLVRPSSPRSSPPHHCSNVWIEPYRGTIKHMPSPRATGWSSLWPVFCCLATTIATIFPR